MALGIPADAVIVSIRVEVFRPGEVGNLCRGTAQGATGGNDPLGSKMAVQIKQWRWLDTVRHASEGGPYDGTYHIETLPNGGKQICLYNGPGGATGTVINLTTSADVTNFTNADKVKHK